MSFVNEAPDTKSSWKMSNLKSEDNLEGMLTALNFAKQRHHLTQIMNVQFLPVTDTYAHIILLLIWIAFVMFYHCCFKYYLFVFLFDQ